VKVLVVDDEKPARERLTTLLEALPSYQYCGEGSNGAEALRLTQTLQPDIILMDIRMPGMDGLEAARYLASLDEPPAVIFTTAYDEHALEAFEAHAVGYLLKPIDQKRLGEALAKARIANRAQLAEMATIGTHVKRTHICARLGGRLEIIPLSDVLYFQADQKYVTVHHRRGEVIIEDSLKSLETEFAPLCLRIHRNALVVTTHLVGLEKTSQGCFQVVLKGIAARLEVSRRHLAAVRSFVRAR
jgi:two-component system response regulator AlgR